MENTGFTDKGYVAPRAAEYLSHIRDRYEALTGLQVDWSRDTFLGQISALMAQQLGDLAESAQGLYDAFNVNNAQGLHLDSLAMIVGVRRNEATYSTALIRVRGEVDTFIPIDSEFDDKQERVWRATTDRRIGYTLTIEDFDTQVYSFSIEKFGEVETYSYTPPSGGLEDVVDIVQRFLNQINTNSAIVTAFSPFDNVIVLEALNSGAFEVEALAGLISVEEGESYLTVQSVLSGPVIALPGEIVENATTIDGLEEVTNPQRAIPGQPRETDPELRAKRQDALARIGAASLNVIRAQVLEVQDVQAVVAVDNDKDFTQEIAGLTLPPKSIAVIVYPGPLDGEYNQNIAEAIYAKATSGIETIGDQLVEIVGGDGFSKEVRFSFAIEREIDVEIKVSLAPGYLLVDVEDEIEEAITDFFLALRVGQSVFQLPILALINTIDGVLGATVTFDELDEDVTIPIEEIAILNSINVEAK